MKAECSRVLLIADNAAEISRIKDMLSDSDSSFVFDQVSSWQEGRNLLDGKSIQVVLADLNLIEGGWSESVQAIRSVSAGIGVIVMGEEAPEKMLTEAYKAGAQGYLTIGESEAATVLPMLMMGIEHSRLTSEIDSLSSELKITREKVDQHSRIDALTGLLNLKGMEKALDIEFQRIQRTGAPLVAVLVNLDDFKELNDDLGHAVGDLILKEVGEKLEASLRPLDHLCRSGGDEFLVLLPETRFAEGLTVAERLRLAVAEGPFHIYSEGVKVTASLGVVLMSPYETRTLAEVMSLTRMAVKESKGTGKNKVSVAGTTGDDKTKSKVKAIVETIQSGRGLRAVTLPILDLEDESIEGYELLSRGPEGEFESPVDFFRLCREMNVLTLVDLQCLRVCIKHARTLSPKSVFHVNLFPSTILDTPVERLLEFFPLDEDCGTFCVELNEQQFIGEPSYLKERLVALREKGILIALDDVGFGRSSLETLIVLEPDIVKIDRSYVTGLAEDEGKYRALKRLIQVIQTLGCGIVAEGIEERSEANLLREMGVKYGQGFLWGKPS